MFRLSIRAGRTAIEKQMMDGHVRYIRISGYGAIEVISARRGFSRKGRTRRYVLSLLGSIFLVAATRFWPALLAVGLTFIQTAAANTPGGPEFFGEPSSVNVQQMADWVISFGDNENMPFVIVDKTDAKVFVFGPVGKLRGAAPALLGLARGDVSAAGIGRLKLSGIGPGERITPAGRFVAALGHNDQEKDILWVDYDAGLSLHRVITSNPAEHRLQRLTTVSPVDNRISYGCINVPAKFYDMVVKPAFMGTKGVVYILPEIRTIRDVFPAYGTKKRTVSEEVKPATPQYRLN